MTSQPKELQDKEALLRGIEKLDFIHKTEANKASQAKSAPSNIFQSEFGKDPKNSLQAYLNSPGYKALKSRIMKDIILLDSIKQEQQFAARQKLLKLRIMFFLLLSLYLEKAKAKSELNIKIFEQLQDTFKKEKKLRAKQAEQHSQFDLSTYESTIAPLADRLKVLDDRISELDKKIALKEEEEAQVRKDAENFESILIQLQAVTINELETIKNDLIIGQSINPPKKPLEVHYVGYVEKMLQQKNGEKVYYTADGKRTDSIMQAAYIIPASKILHKEGDTFYILNKGEPLTEASKLAGKIAFERQKKDFIAPIAALRNDAKEALDNCSKEKDALQNEKRQCIAESLLIQTKLENSTEATINLTPIPNAVKDNIKEEVAENTSPKDNALKTTVELTPQQLQESQLQLEQTQQGNPQMNAPQLAKDKLEIAKMRLSPLPNTPTPNSPSKGVDAKPVLDIAKKALTPDKPEQAPQSPSSKK